MQILSQCGNNCWSRISVREIFQRVAEKLNNQPTTLYSELNTIHRLDGLHLWDFRLVLKWQPWWACLHVLGYVLVKPAYSIVSIFVYPCSHQNLSRIFLFNHHLFLTCLQLSDEGRGVAGISNMLTLTRLHNTIFAASGMRRYSYLDI